MWTIKPRFLCIYSKKNVSFLLFFISLAQQLQLQGKLQYKKKKTPDFQEIPVFSNNCVEFKNYKDVLIARNKC